MKADDTLEATEVVPDGPEGALTTLGSTFGGDEQAVININNLVIKVRKVDFEEKKFKANIQVKNKAIIKKREEVNNYFNNQVESGIGNNTIPLLLLESRFNCDIRDWSGPRMSVIGSMNLEMAYYNAKLALWEPVIEPIVSVNPGDV